jgi:hypothetical protein
MNEGIADANTKTYIIYIMPLVPKNLSYKSCVTYEY